MNGTNHIILWKVDTINDFFEEKFEHEGQTYSPGLPVPGADSIRKSLARLVKYAWTADDWRVLGGVDAHTDDPKHFAKWPKHGIKNTPGQMQIEETKLPNALYVPIEKVSDNELEEIMDHAEPIYFEKKERKTDTDPDASLSPRVNENVAPVLARMKPKAIVLAGVVLGYCVKQAVDYFLELGYKVAVATDAIKEFEKKELELYHEWERKGVIITTTSKIVNGELEAKL